MLHVVRALKPDASNWVWGVFLLMLAATFTGEVHASCGVRDRIKHEDSDCLTAKWDNHYNWLNHGRWKIKSECSNYGKVVAKIDIKHTWDEEITLSNSEWQSGDTDLYNVRYIYCCADLSDLCNRSDIESN